MSAHFDAGLLVNVVVVFAGALTYPLLFKFGPAVWTIVLDDFCGITLDLHIAFDIYARLDVGYSGVAAKVVELVHPATHCRSLGGMACQVESCRCAFGFLNAISW
jgi:hypothetical protein